MVEKITKKQKKASEFRNKKKKLDDSIADVPEEDTPETTEEKDTESKAKTSLKRKERDTETTATDAGSTADGKKKRRRGKGSTKDQAAKEGVEETEKEANTDKAVKAPPKNQKFIVFVGKISSVRVQTDKVTKKGKGFAFMEFPDVESMQKALFFNKTLIKERPINVELTAGGGGNKSAARKQKIAEKNEALNEERRKLHEKHIAPAKEAKSSYAAANPPVVQKAAPKNIKKPHEISGANSISVDGLAARLRKA
ncbi:hypothetical protein BGZ80_006681 [Entomortierella chlamydospora]|uniref:RRM domain-containing protein n=1 Tax=Entomortierella chlamydospora TaxID=101097 RepID=A0A9P6STC1_9FUNG|nr:hypothetical protein BGZ79_000568 [Entomortierella chlamydospora]KAF9998963.1 hypothetical protein BGZ80_006681 [Entomortierella chlamydospora]